MQAIRLGAVVDRIDVREYGHECQSLVFAEHIQVILQTPEDCDEVIRAAAEAKRLLDPPFIIDSERDCPEKNPDTREHCYRGGDHGVHRDSNGDEWRTDAPSGMQQPAPVVRVTDDGRTYSDEHAAAGR